MNGNFTDAEADKVNAYLGQGTYERWDPLDAEAKMLLNKRKKADEVLWKFDKRSMPQTFCCKWPKRFPSLAWCKARSA